MVNLKFENRAWRGIRAVSNRAVLTEGLRKTLNNDKYRSVIFEIIYHYTKKQYAIDLNLYVYLTEVTGRASGYCDPCYGSMLFFNSIKEATDFLQSMGYSITNPEEVKEITD